MTEGKQKEPHRRRGLGGGRPRHSDGEDGRPYAVANRAILEQAELLALESRAEAGHARDPLKETELPKLAVSVWDGAPREVGDMTAEFLDEARRRGFDTVEISTL